MRLPNLSTGYSTFDPDRDVPDLEGKVVLITGANSGIGFTAARQLAKHGAKVYVGARNEERGRAAVESIKEELGGGHSEVYWHHVDLSSPASAKAAARAFMAIENRLDVLINNAGIGCGVQSYSTVPCGAVSVEKMMAVNYLGPFVLTNELLPLLTKTANLPASDVRVISVTSLVHQSVPSNAGENLRSLHGWNLGVPGDSYFQSGHRYNQTKLAIVLFIRELQRRLSSSSPPIPITCMAVNPGLVKTTMIDKFAERNGWLGAIFGFFVGMVGLDAERGGWTTVFAASTPGARELGLKGAYVSAYDRVQHPSKLAMDDALAGDLWQCTEDVVESCLRKEGCSPPNVS